VALTHQHGCSVRADGPGMAMLRRTLGGYASHPNVGGVLVVGLGCEDNNVEEFLGAAGLAVSDRLAVRVIQQEGGTAATVAAGVEALRAMLPQAAAKRSRVPARKLVVGLQCGGSDAFSGISANPAVGLAADQLVAEGGTVILSETPEIYGAESLLLDRTPDPAVAARLIGLLDWWREYARRDGGTLDNNPSPGNRDGGITTILEKSLGAVTKGGSSPLRGVFEYAEPVATPGLVFMDSPGYDPVSVTGQVAGGANLVCFTTGRGSCFGCAPAPSVKIASTSEIFRRMAGDIDINAGTIIDGNETHAEVAARIFRSWLDTASGRPTASELLGYGEEEFAPWTPGLVY
jgi:altronate hydrolase